MGIKEEFENIFGVNVRPNLFDADDVEYQQLRQQIINSPKEITVADSLPFEGVRLTSYVEYKCNVEIEKALSQGVHLFYIKEYSGEKLIISGAGYYRVEDSSFVVLKNCFFKTSYYFTKLSTSISDPEVKSDFLSSFRYDGGVLYQCTQRYYHSASLAASYILGKKSTFREWKDSRGKTLDAYYPEFRSADIDKREIKTFPDYLPTVVRYSEPRKETLSVSILDVVDSVLRSKIHPFYLKISDVCDASGYYEKEGNRFVVMKGSRFFKTVSPSFSSTKLGESRMRFIAAACLDDGEEYIVKENTRCKSPSAAASYIQGKVASYVQWIDSDGKYLKDLYPEIFVQAVTNVKPVPTVTKPVINNLLHIFFIKRDGTVGRDCDASGTFDPATQKFIIRAGSVLALDMSTTYRYSPAGIARRNFLNKFCTKEGRGYRLRRDQICDSPSAAAALVMGGSANGWEVWKDVKGYSLDLVYRR